MNSLLLVVTLGSFALAGAPLDDLVPLSPRVTLDDEDRDAIESGETIYRYEHTKGIESGVSARLVQAPPEVVWAHILDFDAYVDFLPYVTASTLDTIDASGDQLECTMELTTKGVVTRYIVHNQRYRDEDLMVFTMVAQSGSTVRSLIGSWRVEPWAADPDHTLISYRVQIDTAWWVPRFTKRYAAKQGLPTITRVMGERALAH